MRSFFITLALSGVFVLPAQAQSDTAKAKCLNHYVGVQINQFLKQIINLNANQVPFTYPYLVTYSVSSVKYGCGLNVGFGYNYQRFLDKNTPSNHETKINDFFYRAGIGKRFVLGKKFEASAGLDYIGQNKLNKTVTSSVIDTGIETDSSTTNSETKENGNGFGVQASINFHISEKVLIGTESTFYYMKTNPKQSVIVTETFTNDFTGEITSRSLSATNTETEKSDFTITVPVAVFLIIKF